jgi:hypothetical protein
MKRPTFSEFKKKALKNPEVKKEYDRLKPILKKKNYQFNSIRFNYLKLKLRQSLNLSNNLFSLLLKCLVISLIIKKATNLLNPLFSCASIK